MKMILLVLFYLFFSSCFQSVFFPPDYCDQDPPYFYGPPTNINFKLSSYRPGGNAAHTLTFDITECHLETYQVVITYPIQFAFNGFLALGSAGTQIGSYNLDLHVPDGVIDYTIPVYSIDNDTAYADRFLDGTYDPSVDAVIEYTYSGGNHVLTTTIPDGGDGRSGTVEGPFTERLIAIINPGIFTNPVSLGTYNVSGDFTSVDPDTDNADDGSGYPVQTLNYSENVVIRSPVNPGVILNLLSDE